MCFTISPAPGAPADQDGTLVVVEGYMDVIALAQAGIDNVVAPLGTALTENQLKLIWRVTPQPVLCFDGDEAGQRAANRTVDLALPLIATGPLAADRGAAAGQGSRRSGPSGRARAL
jgi:DNA primase